MLCILSLCQTPKGDAAKTNFATPPHYALFMFVFFERNGAVEDEMFGSGIGVDVVVSRASELQIGQRIHRKQKKLSIQKHLQMFIAQELTIPVKKIMKEQQDILKI